ncbi:hypothetical protein KKI23_01040 [Patescibacteria group bacterium]|nr:hypothetical protein [Patescibacteria group bacterium]
MNIHAAIFFITALLEIVLALYVYLRNRKNEINVSFALFVFGGFLYALASALFLSMDEGVALFWGKMSYLGGTLAAVFFLYFSLTFPFKKLAISWLHKIAFFLPIILFTILIFSTDTFTTSFFEENNLRYLKLGPSYDLFVIFFVCYWIWALVNLFNKYKVSDGIHRWQLKYFLWGAVITSIIIVVFDLFLPLFDIRQFSIFAPELILIWFGFTAYILFGKR